MLQKRFEILVIWWKTITSWIIQRKAQAIYKLVGTDWYLIDCMMSVCAAKYDIPKNKLSYEGVSMDRGRLVYVTQIRLDLNWRRRTYYFITFSEIIQFLGIQHTFKKYIEAAETKLQRKRHDASDRWHAFKFSQKNKKSKGVDEPCKLQLQQKN
ncbi:hypothetical protein HGO21_16660 [Acinetobacter sp. CUI P1]|nr:hypothetical protein [Acinetobacter sp. CUI P1]